MKARTYLRTGAFFNNELSLGVEGVESAIAVTIYY